MIIDDKYVITMNWELKDWKTVYVKINIPYLLHKNLGTGVGDQINANFLGYVDDNIYME